MEKYVYKITNLINGKIYIGQTNNVKRRYQEHLHDKRNGHPIHLAMKKYGRENFVCDILYHGENYNEEERQWIAHYEANNKDKGYNITSGGQDSSGESNPMAKITQEQAQEVIDLLLYTNLSVDEISNETGLSVGFINHINHGESWSSTEYTYPLKSFSNKLPEKLVERIINLLKDNNVTIDDIVKETGVPRYTVLGINNGKHYARSAIEYPIRDVKLSKDTISKIVDLLSTTDMLYKDIAKDLGVSTSIVSKINRGTSWHDENLTYPIRNNGCRA